MFRFIKKNKHGMLISELCRLFTVKKLLIGILLTSGIAVFSVSDSISLDSIYLSREFKQSICDQLQLSLTFDRYKSLYVIATSLCTVTMVPSDIKNHVLPYIRQRSDTNEMIVSRLISVALYIIVVVIMGFLLAGILLTPLMNRKLAWIYLGIMAFNLALSIIPVCYLAIIVSIFRPDGYIAIGAAFFSFYFLFYCTNSLPWIFSYSTLSSRPGNASYSEMIYNFLFFSCCMVLSGLGVKKAMERKKDSRVWLVFIVSAFLVVKTLGGITKFGLQYQMTSTPFLLPVLFADNSIANGLAKIMLYFAFIVLICNAPFKDERICYIIARSGRRAWWLGGILYSVATSFLFLLFLMIVAAGTILPVCTLKPYWGTAVKSLIIASGDIKAQYLESSLPSDVITLLYPPAAQMITFITVWLNLIFLSLLIYFVNGCNEKIKLGSMVAAALVLLDPVIRWIAYTPSRFWLYYISPVSWSSIENWTIVGSTHPLNGQIVVCASIILNLIMLCLTFIVEKRSIVQNNQ